MGRTGVFEMLPMDQDIATLVSDGASEQQIQNHLGQNKIDCLFDDGFGKVQSGITSLEEVAAVINQF